MRYTIVIVLLFGLCACRHENPSPDNFRPDFLSWKYTAHININGVDVLKYLKAYKIEGHSRIYINMNSTDANYNYYYPLGISIPNDVPGTFRLHSLGTYDSLSYIGYIKECCYSNPDVSYAEYNIDENDSVNNFIRVHIDNVALEISGMFKATMVNDRPPVLNSNEPDTVRMRCDTFYCKYAIQ